MRALVILAAVLLCSRPAWTEVRADWERDLLGEIDMVLDDANCRGDEVAGSVHVLAVSAEGATEVVPADQTMAVVKRAAELLGSERGLVATHGERVAITASSGTARADALRALQPAAANADLALALAPLSLAGEVALYEAIVFANVGDAVRCLETGVLRVPESATRDACSAAYNNVVDAGHYQNYEVFSVVFARCPQAAEARRFMREHCSAALAAMTASRTCAAYRTFVLDHDYCPEARGARPAMDVVCAAAEKPAAAVVEPPPEPAPADPAASDEAALEDFVFGPYMQAAQTPDQSIIAPHLARSLAWFPSRFGPTRRRSAARFMSERSERIRSWRDLTQSIIPGTFRVERRGDRRYRVVFQARFDYLDTNTGRRERGLWQTELDVTMAGGRPLITGIDGQAVE